MSLEPERVEQARPGHIGFRVASLHLALPLLAAVQILDPPPITRVPRLPDFVRGVANLRGRILPILDLARRLGQGATSARGRLVVAASGDVRAGFLVDAVTGALVLADIAPPTVAPPRVPLAVIAGATEYEGQTVYVLDVDALLAADRNLIARAPRRSGTHRFQALA